MSINKARYTTVVAAAIAVMLAAVALRVAFLDCDPPHGLSTSRAEYTDEGLKFYQARNRALFGQWWIKTPWAVQGHLKSSPVPTVIAWGVFEVFGVGRVQARCISVVAGVLSCGLLMLIGARSGKREVGLLAGAFAAVNFLLVSYDRLALFESLLILELLTAALFFLDGGWRRWTLCPALLAMAYLTRVSAVAIVAAFAVAWLVEVRRKRAAASKKAVFAAVASIVLVATLLVAVLMVPGNQVLAHVRARFHTAYFETFPPATAAADLFVRAFADSRLAAAMPLLTVLALLSFSARPRSVDPERPPAGGSRTTPVGESAPRPVGAPVTCSPHTLFSLWLAAGFLLIAFLEYRPTRYYVLLLPPVMWLAADWIVSLARGSRELPQSWRGFAGWALLRFLAGIAIAGVLLRFAVEYRQELPMFVNVDSAWIERFRDLLESNFIGTVAVLQPRSADHVAGLVAAMDRHVLFMCLVGFAVLSASAAWAFIRRKLLPAGLPPRAGAIAALAVAFGILAAQVAQQAGALEYRTRRYEVLRAEKEITRIIGDNPRACIAGNWAPTLCMGTPYLTLPFAKGNGNSWETFRRFPVTHFVLELGSPNEELYLMNAYRVQYDRCKLLKTFQIDFYSIGLFEYVPPPEAPVAPWPFKKRSQ
jgi:4-amino-4-deoxy-L-arabinose transferase-like glycosyltransferase